MAVIDNIFLLTCAVLVGMLALGSCFVIPVSRLPVVALILYCVIPQKAIPGAIVQLFAPGLLVLLIWGLRRWLAQDDSKVVSAKLVRHAPGVRRASLLFVAISFCLGFLSISRFTSFGWLVYFAVALLIPIFVKDVSDEAHALRRSIPVLGSAIALWSILEFAVGRDPVYDAIFSLVGREDYQHWMSYRADGTFGHPLFAGTFFAIAVTVSVASWMTYRRKSFIVYALLSGVGLVLTLSRGAFLAAGLGVLVVLLVASVGRARGYSQVRSRGTLGVLGGAGIFFLILSQVDFVTDRLGSSEARASNEGRSSVLDISLRAAESYQWVGSGPGTSRAAASPFNFINLPIESGYLELLISVGVIGLLAFIGIGIFSLIDAARRRDLIAVSLIVPFFIAIAGYNSLDGQRSTALLLGLVLLAACGADRREDPTPQPDSAAVDGVRSGSFA